MNEVTIGECENTLGELSEDDVSEGLLAEN